MNTLRKSFVIGMTVFGMATATLGVQAGEARHQHSAKHEAGGAKRAEGMAGHLAALHDKLKLSAAQEPAWATFIAAAKPPASTERPDAAALAKMSAPERMEKWIALSQLRLAAQQNSLAALKTFYAELTPEQRKILDANVPGGRHSGMNRMHGGMNNMHGGMAGGMHSGMHAKMKGMHSGMKDGEECDMHEAMHGAKSAPAKP
ncbi:MAG: Spy/CpxP family protein refolding chaperone [Burkholderiaceae bacterium]|nr:Spy/CpxP family protein refolding chaperone [Burkholderiaceae bacterium]